jgi:hypothetical protein
LNRSNPAFQQEKDAINQVQILLKSPATWRGLIEKSSVQTRIKEQTARIGGHASVLRQSVETAASANCGTIQ